MRLDGHSPADVERAARRLAAGGLVAFATETVYGLGARADDADAVAAVFAAKGRPSDHPLIVHLADPGDAAAFCPALPAPAQRLMDAFWPGPLTVIVARRPGVAAAAAGGQDSIGLRCPAHPVARALLGAARRLGVPGIAAPSANRFGRISPTLAQHVEDEFGADLAVLDGGPCELGIESTIVDCSRGRPVLLRPGMLTRAQLDAAAGEPLADRDAGAPRASGTLAAHYAPRARLQLMPAAALQAAVQALPRFTRDVAVYSRSPPSGLPAGVGHRCLPETPAAAAHELFAVLRELDAQGVNLIWVEEPPPQPEWDGVRDRLRRAAAA